MAPPVSALGRGCSAAIGAALFALAGAHRVPFGTAAVAVHGTYASFAGTTVTPGIRVCGAAISTAGVFAFTVCADFVRIAFAVGRATAAILVEPPLTGVVSAGFSGLAETALDALTYTDIVPCLKAAVGVDIADTFFASASVATGVGVFTASFVNSSTLADSEPAGLTCHTGAIAST